MAYGANGSNSPFDTVLSTVQSTANFRGRSRRSELGYFIILFIFIGFIPIFGVFARMIMFVAIPALMVRRVHDCNFSGWLALFPFLPLIFIFLSDYVTADTAKTVVGLLASLSSFAIIGFILAAIFWPGTTGPNKYGFDPRLDEPWEFENEAVPEDSEQ